MREIKFRAWEVDERKMLSWDDLDDGEYDSWPTMYYALTNKRYHPMQFTGLTDRNGKEIYEGDVVREVLWTADQKEGIRHEIKWYPRNCCFGYSGMMQICESNACDWEVIGNIYENPDLCTK